MGKRARRWARQATKAKACGQAAEARRRMAAMSADEILALAREPVPMGIGVEEIGQGPFMYVKSNVLDGSTRCFRFPTQAAAMEAMAIGVAHDSPLPGMFAEA